MNNKNDVNEISFKWEKPVIVLLIITAICRLIGCLSLFMYYRKGDLTLFPVSFSKIITVLLAILPPVLALLYIKKFNRKSLSELMLTVAFLLIPIDLNSNYYYSTLIVVLLFVLALLAIINSMIGFKIKVIHIVAMSVYLLIMVKSIYSLISRMSYFIEYERYMDIIVYPAEIIGICCLYVALLLFGLNTNFKNVFLFICASKLGVKMPEAALKILNLMLRLNIISKEEYTQKRIELINQLVQ